MRTASLKYFARGFALLLFVLNGCASPQPMAPMAPYYPKVPTTTSVTLPAPLASPRTIEHIVGPSETLWRISKTYNVSIDTLMRENGIKNESMIRSGQVIRVPSTRGPVPVIPLYPTHRWTHIVIHHTATQEGNAYSIDDLHHKRGFWNGLGYHFLIDNGTDGKWDGQIEVGPRWIKQMDGAHANKDGMNQRGIGISLVGNYSISQVSDRQLDALVLLVTTLQDYYHIPSSNVIGHRDVPGKSTECPGNNFPWMEFKSRIHR